MPVRTTAALFMAMTAAVSAHAATTPIPFPPNTPLKASLVTDESTGTPTLVLENAQGKALMQSRLGLRTTEVDLTHDLKPGPSSHHEVTEHYTMTTGKRLERSATMVETRFPFTGPGGTELDVVVRTARDGIAWRYELPGSVNATVKDEATDFAFPEETSAWLLPYKPQYEGVRSQDSAYGSPVGDFGYPSLFEVNGDYLLVTESNTDGRYTGSRMRHGVDTSTYDLVLFDASASFHGSTPWRTVIAGDLATVTQSTLVDDLADPARFSDTSWIKPGKVAWSWLSEHQSPGDPERQKAYVDFAARNHLPYVLVDEGWKDAWVPDLVKYANARHVDILLWFRWTNLDTEDKRQAILPKIKGWGVKGVKVDFMDSDSQARYQWYDAILADTAKLHLMVNFHGATIPHGLARTWPHIMSMEAVRGTENDPPVYPNTVQPFTRNVVGSMDYTPVAFDAGPRMASIAHETALSVVFESGWQHLADSPEAYDKRPNALAFLDQVPTVWDETKLLSGTPGKDIVIARRSGKRWFIGGIRAGAGETLHLPLAELGKGQWLVDTVEDAPGEGRGDVIHRTVHGKGDTMDFTVKKDGGFAAVACPATAGRSSCYDPL